MPTVISAPVQNSVLNDANTTEIIIEDLVEFDYYSAKIYLNNVLFDEVILPKFTNSNVIFRFENLLQKYITLVKVTDTILKDLEMIFDLKIELYRHQTATILFNTLNYKLLYCTHPKTENYTHSNFTFIGVEPDVMVIGNEGKIVLPFYTENTTDDIRITLMDNNYNFYYENTFINAYNHHSLLFNFDFINTTNANSLLLEVRVGANRISKKFRVLKNTVFEPKQVLFYNEFGFPVVANLFGKQINKDDLTYFKYQNSSNNYKLAEIQTDVAVSVDTGYLTESEKPIVEQITQSLSTFIKINNQFVECIATTKTITTISDNDFLKSSVLQFEYNKYPKIKN